MAILGYIGLRKGEILTLKWKDVSLNENLIHVRRAIVIAGTSIDNPGIIKAPKTEAGIRTVPIAEPLKQSSPSIKHLMNTSSQTKRQEGPFTMGATLKQCGGISAVRLTWGYIRLILLDTRCAAPCCRAVWM